MYCTVQSTPYTRLEIVLQNIIRRLRSEQKVSEAHVAPTCRIPGHFIYMSLHQKATIVVYLVLQSTPTYVDAVAGYSIIAPNLRQEWLDWFHSHGILMSRYPSTAKIAAF